MREQKKRLHIPMVIPQILRILYIFLKLRLGDCSAISFETAVVIPPETKVMQSVYKGRINWYTPMPSEPIALVRNTLYMKDREPVIRLVIVRIKAPCM